MGAFVLWRTFTGMEPAVPTRKMIVVLPFENLGPPEHEYFASGITEEITSRLAAVHDLGVISRKSAVHYAKTDKPLTEIGEELGVDYVLEGTVRWETGTEGAERVRVTPQLIRVADDTHMWSEIYDREISEIFQVQSEIGEQITGELGMTLLAPERRAIEARPTESLDAYQAYLRGRHYFARPEFWGKNLRLALDSFQQAVELDPGFAAAYAELSKAHSAHVHFGMDLSEERRHEAKRAVDRALELAPELPEAHLALGLYHYWAERDYERALEELAVAERGMPNSAEVVEPIAAVQQRRGHGQEALASFQKAVKLNPRDARLAAELSAAYAVLKRYREAMDWLDESIALAPNQSMAYTLKAWIYWVWKGTTEESRAALEASPEPDDVLAPWFWFWQEIHEGNTRAALENLSSLPGEWIFFIVLESPKSLLLAYAYELLDEHELARSNYDSARILLEKEVQKWPEDAALRSALGLAYAGLGRKEEAIREGQRAVELYPVSKDAFWGPSHVEYLAWIYTMTGENDAALDQLEYLLSIPSMVSAPLLQIDRRWDPLRDHPRFQKLIR
jgi:serine/threonine-protein kinase